MEIAIALMSGLEMAAAAVSANAAVPVVESVTVVSPVPCMDSLGIGVWWVAAAAVWLWPAVIADAA